MEKVFEIIGRITILIIAYFIGYLIFIKLNKNYTFAYVYSGVIGQIYLLSSIKFKEKE